ncbi:piggyBac transposable element-derived 2-like protein [Labeo rohita]|uniref:PiggyBac transposable element-derived 2-like protein n=1 Tax=Labeo rohita TaxID=84645 RepID=A0A498M9K3_LABRO|nr:piggyBac transposable element-derived 2-like protein [Labeo rohita]
MSPNLRSLVPTTVSLCDAEKDNDPKHTSRLCKGYLTKKESDGVLRQMTWPPQSLDLNPIEMVWDMIVVTCWLLYKWHCKCNNLSDAEVMRMYAFKSYIAQGLCKSGKSLEKNRGWPSSGISSDYETKKRQGPTAPIPIPDVRLDATAHWIIMSEKKGRCRVPGCKGTPNAKCRKCNAHLCFTSTTNCFLKFHTE